MFDTIWHMLCMLCMFFSPYLYRNANETTKPNITKLYKIQTICDFVYFVLEETLENIKVVYDQGPRGTTSLAAASWHNRRNRHLPNARVIQVTFALSHFRTFGHCMHCTHCTHCETSVPACMHSVRMSHHIRTLPTLQRCWHKVWHLHLILLYSTCAWFVCYSSHQDRPAAKCHIHILCISMCLRSVGFFPSSMLFVFAKGSRTPFLWFCPSLSPAEFWSL